MYAPNNIKHEAEKSVFFLWMAGTYAKRCALMHWSFFLLNDDTTCYIWGVNDRNTARTEFWSQSHILFLYKPKYTGPKGSRTGSRGRPKGQGLKGPAQGPKGSRGRPKGQRAQGAGLRAKGSRGRPKGQGLKGRAQGLEGPAQGPRAQGAGPSPRSSKQ